MIKTIGLVVLLLAGDALAENLILDEKIGLTEKIEVLSYNGYNMSVEAICGSVVTNRPLASFSDAAQELILAWVADENFKSSSALHVRIKEEADEREMAHGNRKFVSYLTTLENRGAVALNDIEVVSVVFVERQENSSKSKVRGFNTTTLSLATGESADIRSLVADIRDYEVPSSGWEVDQGSHIDVYSTKRDYYEDELKGFRLILLRENRAGERIDRSVEEGNVPKTDDDRKAYRAVSETRASKYFGYRDGFMAPELWHSCKQLGLYEPFFEAAAESIRFRKWDRARTAFELIRSLVREREEANEAVSSLLEELTGIARIQEFYTEPNETASQKNVEKVPPQLAEMPAESSLLLWKSKKWEFSEYDPRKEAVTLTREEGSTSCDLEELSLDDQSKIIGWYLDEKFPLSKSLRCSISEHDEEARENNRDVVRVFYEIELDNRLDVTMGALEVMSVVFYEEETHPAQTYQCEKIYRLELGAGETKSFVVEPVTNYVRKAVYGRLSGYTVIDVKLLGVEVFISREDSHGNVQTRTVDSGRIPRQSKRSSFRKK